MLPTLGHSTALRRHTKTSLIPDRMNLTSEIQPVGVPGCWKQASPFPSFSTCPLNQELPSGQTAPCHIIRICIGDLHRSMLKMVSGDESHFHLTYLKTKGKWNSEYIQCHLDMTVRSGLQQRGKKKSKCTDESFAIHFQILGIKLVTRCSIWKALGEGTDQAVCIWAFFLSQIIHVSLPTPWGLVMHCSSLSSCWNPQTEGIL